MLVNLMLEINANSVLTFVWVEKPLGGNPEQIFWLLELEDPTSGAPFAYVDGPYSRLSWAGAEALRYISTSPYFEIRAAEIGYPALAEVLERSYGKDFSAAILACLRRKDPVSGSAYSTFGTARTVNE